MTLDLDRLATLVAKLRAEGSLTRHGETCVCERCQVDECLETVALLVARLREVEERLADEHDDCLEVARAQGWASPERLQAAEGLAEAAEAVKASTRYHSGRRYVLELDTLTMDAFVTSLATFRAGGGKRKG